jgi:tetratricopeptide (TPR) repeat protein
MSEGATRSAPQSGSSRWLFGPAPDLLLGCGLGYLGAFAALLVLGPAVKAWLPLTLLAMVSLVAGGPHYGATLLRVYEQRAARRRYAVFSVGVTGLLVLAFLAALHFRALGSFLVTLYFLWSPWHYSGQNYGIALLFLHRRGFDVTPRFKRLLQASFVIAFALAIVQVNGTAPGAIFAPNAPDPSASNGFAVYHAVPLGIPDPAQRLLMIAGVTGYLACLAALAIAARGRIRDLAPAAAVVLTQSLWFAIPAAARYWGILQEAVPTGILHSAYVFQFVAAGHAVQYLWITTYYAQSAGETRRASRFYGKALLAGAALWGLPYLFARSVVGGAIDYGTLYLLVAAVVNLHHFVLDGAIWKLRDAGIGAVLLRASPPGATPVAERERSWLRPLIWATGALFFAISVISGVATHEFNEGIHNAEWARAQRAAGQLAFLGEADFDTHRVLGTLAARLGYMDRALEALDESLRLHPTPDALYAQGMVYKTRGELGKAIASWEALHELTPAAYPRRAALALADAYVEAGRVDRARALLRDALSRAGEDAELKQHLEQLGDPPPGATSYYIGARTAMGRRT